MPERGPVEVTVEIGGREVVAGTLWVHERRGASATFQYDPAYLADPDAYPLDPAIPLSSGSAHTPAGKAMFNAFADSTPDRWGQNLMRQSAAAAGRTTPLTTADFLLGVRDDARQGAIRFRRPGTSDYFSAAPDAVPRLVGLSRLLSASDRYLLGDPEGLAELAGAGSSLGGARPKAAVVDDDGRLSIAKFSKRDDDWDLCGWEKLALDLARRAGIRTEESSLAKIGKRSVLLVARFDRDAGRRIGFTSALTMLEASDLETRSYPEIAEVLGKQSPTAAADLEQLYRRMVFSILVSNTDDHLRNHGLLRTRGGWTLAPAYDINPNPETSGVHATMIGFDDPRGSIDTAILVAAEFGLNEADARRIAAEVEAATRQWRGAAAELGLRRSEIDLMAAAFDTPERQVAQGIDAKTAAGLTDPQPSQSPVTPERGTEWFTTGRAHLAHRLAGPSAYGTRAACGDLLRGERIVPPPAMGRCERCSKAGRAGG
ncbi:MAG TPA: type II toxin-antitoxin system HipA family toxin [Acidimicrobiales bacterium]|nr:type II toxin-antitoxin system HipA family toxin [Acidimicrobiales bacterium]